MKGIVMDVKKNYMIVMSDEGGFYRARKEEAYDVGKEVSFIPLPERKKFFPFPNWKIKLASFATACTVLSGILFAVIPGSVPVYAYVSIDINPSIEFSVGSNWNIIKTTFVNKDGKELLSTLPNMQGKPIDFALAQIVLVAKKEGKLSNKGNVWITSVLANRNQSGAPAMNKLKQLQTDLEVKEKVQIQVGTTTEKVRENAEKIGVSPEKYVYYQNAAKNGTPISIQNLKSDSVSKLESVLHGNNHASVTTNPDQNPGQQKASKSLEESKINSEKSSIAVSQGKKQAGNTPTLKNTGNVENPSNIPPTNQRLNSTDGQQKNNSENRHAK
jgi:hypothetical protein